MVVAKLEFLKPKAGKYVASLRHNVWRTQNPVAARSCRFEANFAEVALCESEEGPPSLVSLERDSKSCNRALGAGRDASQEWRALRRRAATRPRSLRASG
jgi:hypothetical protein